MPEKQLIAPTQPTPNPADKDKKAEAESGNAQSSPSKTKPLDGVTSIDDKVFIECEILVYGALSKIAAQVATEAIGADSSTEAPKPTVVLLDDTLVSALQLYSSLQLQLALFEKGFNGVVPAAPPPQKSFRLAIAPALAITSLTGAVSGVLDLLALFRQDVQFSGRTTTIKETALYLELAREIVKRGGKVLYPKLLSFQAAENVQFSQSSLSQLFDDVFKARQSAADRLRPLLQEVAGFEQEIIDREREFTGATPERQKALTQEIQDLKAHLVSARKNLDPDLVLFENTDTGWNKFQEGLSTPDANSGQVPLQLLNRAAEAIERFKNAQPAFFLYAQGIVAGGTMRIRRTLWQTLFHGDGLEFSGGAVVAYCLFNGAAEIVASGTHRYLTSFQGFPDTVSVWTDFNSF